MERLYGLQKLNKDFESRFDYREIVITKNITDPKYTYLNGKIGVVRGMADDGGGVCRNFSVWVVDEQEMISFEEHELESTGGFVPEDYNRSGESITVGVNEKGKGYIKEDSNM